MTGERREAMRREMIRRDAIEKLLAQGPKTIPDIAKTLGDPPELVLLWVMSLRRHGSVRESGRPDAKGYFAYILNAEKAT